MNNVLRLALLVAIVAPMAPHQAIAALPGAGVVLDASPGVTFKQACGQSQAAAEAKLDVCEGDTAEIPPGGYVNVRVPQIGKSSTITMQLTHNSPTIRTGGSGYFRVPGNLGEMLRDWILFEKTPDPAVGKGAGEQPVICNVVAMSELPSYKLSQASGDLLMNVGSGYDWRVFVYKDVKGERTLIRDFSGAGQTWKDPLAEIAIPNGRSELGEYTILFQEHIAGAPVDTIVKYQVLQAPALPNEPELLADLPSNYDDFKRMTLAMTLVARSPEWTCEGYQMLTDIAANASDENVRKIAGQLRENMKNGSMFSSSF